MPRAIADPIDAVSRSRTASSISNRELRPDDQEDHYHRAIGEGVDGKACLRPEREDDDAANCGADRPGRIESNGLKGNCRRHEPAGDQVRD
jgi:hypothetical protein